MTRPALAALLAGVLAVAPGCTFVFGAAGGGIAAEKSRRQHDTSSIMPAVLGSAAAGMIVDALVIGLLLRGAARD